MTWKEWGQTDAVALSQGLSRGDYSAQELAQQASAAIEYLNPSLDAAREVFHDVIEDPLVDGMDPKGFFRGVPFLMKDLGPSLKGRLQEMGSRFMQGNRASVDSFLTQKIRAAGLNIIGRTSTPEFGVCSSAENPQVCITSCIFLASAPWLCSMRHTREDPNPLSLAGNVRSHTPPES